MGLDASPGSGGFESHPSGVELGRMMDKAFAFDRDRVLPARYQQRRPPRLAIESAALAENNVPQIPEGSHLSVHTPSARSRSGWISGFDTVLRLLGREGWAPAAGWRFARVPSLGRHRSSW